MNELKDLSDFLKPEDFIKLHFILMPDLINKMFLSRLNFKNRNDFYNTIEMIVRSDKRFHLRFVEKSCIIFANQDKLEDNGPLYHDFISPENNFFSWKCSILIEGPNITGYKSFHRESKVFELSKMHECETYEKHFVEKFVNALQIINNLYQTNYVFSFRIVKTTMRKYEKKIMPKISVCGDLTYETQENTETQNICNVIDIEQHATNSKNKKRKVEYSDCDDDTDSDDDFPAY